MKFSIFFLLQEVWVDERGENCGIIKYDNREDFKNAHRKLDDSKLDGVRVRVEPDEDVVALIFVFMAFSFEK